MLVLSRKEGQWIDLTHTSGDRIRIRVYNIRGRFPGRLDLAFDDEGRNFHLLRPGRRVPGAAAAPGGTPDPGGCDIG
jgi:hypothetical protein